MATEVGGARKGVEPEVPLSSAHSAAASAAAAAAATPAANQSPRYCEVGAGAQAPRPAPPPTPPPPPHRVPTPRVTMSGRSLGRLCPSTSVLLLCDLQERFRHRVRCFPAIVTVAARVLQGCQALGVPALVTEQRPEVLGPTVPELGAQTLPRYPKTCFSMVPALGGHLRAPHLRAAILCGIETHACVLQTALDLLELGLEVHVVMDACSSGRHEDRLAALLRLRQVGAFLTTAESLLLLLLRDAANPRFRQVLQLLKEPVPDTGLLPLLGGLGVGSLGGP